MGRLRADAHVGPDHADHAYRAALSEERGECAVWGAQMPHGLASDVRRLKMGAMPVLKTEAVKRVQAFGRLTAGERAQCLACDCGRGVQSPRHFLHDCGYSVGARAAAHAAMDLVVDGARQDPAGAQLASWWDTLTPQAKLAWMLQASGGRAMPVGLESRRWALERHIRRPGCQAWASGMFAALRVVEGANSVFAAVLRGLAQV